MSPRSRRTALTVYAIVGSMVVLLLMSYAIPRMVEAWKQYPWDGKVDWIAARAFVEGRNPYSPEELHKVKLDGLGHPPTTSFWWLPFAKYELMQISPLVGHVIVLAMLVMFFMLAYELRWPMAPLTAMLVFGLTMSSSWMYYHLYLVQVSGFIAFLYFMAWYLLRRGEEVAAGVLLGCACTFKLFPGLLVLVLLLARRWRAVFAAAATYVAIFVYMTAHFGWVSWAQYASTEQVITNYWIGNQHNASIFGVALRILRPACLGAGISRPAGTAIALVLGGALFGGSWWVCRKALRERRLDLPFALFATLSVFMNPFTFEHYFALLVFPLCVALTAWWGAWERGMPRRRWAAVGGLLATVVAFLAFNFRWQDEASWKTQHWLRHALEYANWLHMPLLIAACLVLIDWSEKAGQPLLPEAAGDAKRR
ncbi:MAG: putative integral rane protein [bacterium]|nr:putative integral rane protein [bacterium]